MHALANGDVTGRPSRTHRERKGRLLPLPAAGRSTPPRRMPPPQLALRTWGSSELDTRDHRATCHFLFLAAVCFCHFVSLDGFSVLWSDGLGTPAGTTSPAARHALLQPAAAWAHRSMVNSSSSDHVDAGPRAGSGHLTASVASGMCCDIL
jgi:hypothetical protein